MIIKSIKVRNYKTYLSLDLDLSVKRERPIILIGGLNGGGKTTLFEAICGALYGLKIRNKDHFRELLNNGALGTESPEIWLELTFTGLVLGREQTYILKRGYKLNSSETPVESVSLNMNGNTFVYGSATPPAQRVVAEQQVNKIIKANLPQELSKYFLFDAMQSSDLLKEGVFSQLIRENIENVMGFNKYIQMKRAAERLQQEWAARRLAAEQEAREYNELCAKKSELEDRQRANTAEQDRLYKYLVGIKDDYDIAKSDAKAIADNSVKIENLSSSIAETEKAARNYNDQLREIVETLETDVFLPKVLSNMSVELNALIRHKDELQKKMSESLSLEQVRELTSKILGYLKRKCLCPESVADSEIVDYVVEQQRPTNRVDKYSYIDDYELESLKKMLTAPSYNRFLQLDVLRHDLDTRIDALRDQRMQRDTLMRQQNGGNAELIRDYEAAQKSLESLKQEAEAIGAETGKLDKQIHRYDIQIQQEPDVKYDTLVKLKDFFEDVADNLLKRKKEKIETEMKEQLNELLISYRGCISKVELSDRMEHFSIRLYHKVGNQISLNQLNAASKQIFIQVLLKVLRNLGDYNPPVMIDTVMGVLDAESRDALMELYFPDLAEQTILLCTTSEIRTDSDYVKLQPFVARSYTLKRDVELQRTDVETGYFGIQLED